MDIHISRVSFLEIGNLDLQKKVLYFYNLVFAFDKKNHLFT